MSGLCMITLLVISDHQRNERVDLSYMVVGEQFVVAEGLDLTGFENQRVVIAKLSCLHRESKGSGHWFQPYGLLSLHASHVLRGQR